MENISGPTLNTDRKQQMLEFLELLTVVKGSHSHRPLHKKWFYPKNVHQTWCLNIFMFLFYFLFSTNHLTWSSYSGLIESEFLLVDGHVPDSEFKLYYSQSGRFPSGFIPSVRFLWMSTDYPSAGVSRCLQLEYQIPSNPHSNLQKSR